MVPMSSQLLERVQRPWGEDVQYVEAAAGDGWLSVPAGRLLELCRFLREDAECRCDMLNLISGVDYLHTDPKKAAKASWEPHLEVLYHLSSTVHRHRVVLKVTLPRWKDDAAGALPELPSVTGLWQTAEWHERETYDLAGVRFVGHPDLRRILCPEDWDGHPLRRDYEMPVEYHGIRSPGADPP